MFIQPLHHKPIRKSPDWPPPKKVCVRYWVVLFLCLRYRWNHVLSAKLIRIAQKIHNFLDSLSWKSCKKQREKGLYRFDIVVLHRTVLSLPAVMEPLGGTVVHVFHDGLFNTSPIVIANLSQLRIETTCQIAQNSPAYESTLGRGGSTRTINAIDCDVLNSEPAFERSEFWSVRPSLKFFLIPTCNQHRSIYFQVQLRKLYCNTKSTRGRYAWHHVGRARAAPLSRQ